MTSSRRAFDERATKPSVDGERSTGASRSSSLGGERERVAALLLDRRGEPLELGVGGQQQEAHLAAGSGRAADEAADDLAEEQLGAGGGGVDADAQAGDVDALRDHQHRDQPAVAAGGEPLDRRGRAGVVGGHDRRLLAGDRPEPACDPAGVLLVGSDDEAAGVGVPGRAAVGQPLVGVAQHLADPVAVGVERGAQPPRGLLARQHDVEVEAARLAVGDPLHLAAVGHEGDRPADAVDERVGVRVRVVGFAERVVVVANPRDRRVVGAERRPRQQQPEAGGAEGELRALAPGGQLAHVVRLVGDQQRPPARRGCPVDLRTGGDGLIGHRDPVPIARLGPVGVRPVRLEVDAVAAGVGCPLAADVRRRRRDADTPDQPAPQQLVRHPQPEGRLPGRRRRRRQEVPARRLQHPLERRLLPIAQRSPRGPARQGEGGGRGEAGFHRARHLKRPASRTPATGRSTPVRYR